MIGRIEDSKFHIGDRFVGFIRHLYMDDHYSWVEDVSMQRVHLDVFNQDCVYAITLDCENMQIIDMEEERVIVRNRQVLIAI
jgi:bifunctional pyridoxal-dependent enzyme with beta-cystathionase and maltose regulon repressor activities